MIKADNHCEAKRNVCVCGSTVVFQLTPSLHYTTLLSSFHPHRGFKILQKKNRRAKVCVCGGTRSVHFSTKPVEEKRHGRVRRLRHSKVAEGMTVWRIKQGREIAKAVAFADGDTLLLLPLPDRAGGGEQEGMCLGSKTALLCPSVLLPIACRNTRKTVPFLLSSAARMLLNSDDPIRVISLVDNES